MIKETRNFPLIILTLATLNLFVQYARDTTVGSHQLLANGINLLMKEDENVRSIHKDSRWIALISKISEWKKSFINSIFL